MLEDLALRNKSLTAAFLKNVSEAGKYHDGRGTGLFLLVKPAGGKFWVQRLTIRGKRREIGLGSLQFVSLAAARHLAEENKRFALSGGDPLAEKRKAKRVVTFKEAAIATHAELAHTWKNPKDRSAFLASLETYMFSRFGDVQLPEVTSSDIRKAILAAREKAPGVAKKLTYRVSFVFKWGIAEGMCANNPATRDALALPREVSKTKNRKALPYSEVGECIKVIQASSAGEFTKLALELVILTASRSGEVRLADWSEFNLEAAIWTRPADRMKNGKEHRVPLSSRALEILRKAEELGTGEGFAFPGAIEGRPLSDMTLLKLVKQLGYDVHVHGFRTSFKTWAQEQTNSPRDISEAALAHVVKDKAEAAYARSDYFEKRKVLMQRWASYLSNDEAEILPLRSGHSSLGF